MMNSNSDEQMHEMHFFCARPSQLTFVGGGGTRGGERNDRRARTGRLKICRH